LANSSNYSTFTVFTRSITVLKLSTIG